MKKVLLRSVLASSAFLASFSVMSQDTFNSATGELQIPSVLVDGIPFEVTMQHQGNLAFQVTQAQAFPTQYSIEWLNGRTLYVVEDGGDNIFTITYGLDTLTYDHPEFGQGTGSYTVHEGGRLEEFYDGESDGPGRYIIDVIGGCLATASGLENTYGVDFVCLTEQDAKNAKALTSYNR